jgi:L-fuculose-phosphate aldolase
VPTVETASFRPRRGDLAAAVDAIVQAARALAEAGLVVGASGNLSVRIGDLVAVSATGARLGQFSEEHATIVDLDGRVIEGQMAPTSELALHLEIYRRYAPVSIVHAHPPVATALACVLEELPCIHPDMLELGGSVRVAPYQPFGSQAFAQVTADALEGRHAALMSNHGTVAVGESADQAVERTRLLEWAAGVYWRGASIGTPRALSEEQQQELRAAIGRIGYGRMHPLDS